MRAALRLSFVAWLAAPFCPAAPCRAHPGEHHDIERLTRQIAAEPTRADLHLQRARLHRLAGHMKDSLADLAQAEALRGDANILWLERGLTLSALRRDDEAERAFGRVVAGGSAPPVAFAERARVRERLGRPAEAVTDYTNALALAADVDRYLARARLQQRLDEWDAAAAGLRDGLTACHEAIVLKQELVAVEIHRRQFASALAIVEGELSRRAVKTDWLLRKAEVFDAAGRPAAAAAEREAALNEADRALARRPTAMNLVARARVLAAQSRLDEAERDLRRALSKSPRDRAAAALLNDLEIQRAMLPTKPADGR